MKESVASLRNTSDTSSVPSGAGLGLRRDLADFLLANNNSLPNFVEFAPENWMNIGGRWCKVLSEICERYPITCHGLSLSLGSPEPLDWDFLRRIKKFFKDVPVRLYSEHLSYCKCDNAHFYDLLPIPFRHSAVQHVVQRIKDVQDFLERPLAIENVSYYTTMPSEMDEASFLGTIVKESGCNLLLDVNNVYVNAFNHNYNARDFIKKLPLEKVTCIHMAGHEKRSEDLIIDTHGAAIIDPVYELFDWTLQFLKPVPVLLERDFNYPDTDHLILELSKLQSIIDRSWSPAHAA